MIDARPYLRRALRIYTRHAPIHRGKDRLRAWFGPWLKPSGPTVVTDVPYHQQLRVFVDEYVSDHIYWEGCFERELVTLLAEALRPGMVFVDAGAHVGLYATIAAARVSPGGRVFAFEPSAATFALLSENAALNRHAHLECVRAAVSDCAGAARLHIPTHTKRATSTIAALPGANDIEEVPVVTLDEFLAAREVRAVHAIKADIEGAEKLALAGARRLLASDGAPGLIQLELDERLTRRFGHSTPDVCRPLIEAGYELYRLERRRLHRFEWQRPVEAADCIALKRQTEIAANVVARAPIAR